MVGLTRSDTHPIAPASDEPVILIVDNRRLLCGLYTRAVDSEFPGYRVVGTSALSGADAVGCRLALVVIFDDDGEALALSRRHELETLHRSCPHVPVVLVSPRCTGTYVSEAVRQGVQAVLPIDVPLDIAMSAIRLALVGASYFPSVPVGMDVRPAADQGRTQADRVLANQAPIAANPSAEIVASYMHVGFTLREAQVLTTLERGLSNKAIAKELKIADKTVKAHLHTIMRKLNANNRTEAILQAQERLRHRRTNIESFS